MAKGLTQAALAEALGLTEGRVSQLKSMGMPVESIEAAQRWRHEQQNVAARKPAPADVERLAVESSVHASAGSVFVPPPQQPLVDSVGEDFQAARTRREIAEANLAELKEAEQQGSLIQVEAVRAAWARRLAATRDAILQIPIRVAPVLAAEASIDQVSILLEAELRQALADLSRDSLPGAPAGEGVH